MKFTSFFSLIKILLTRYSIIIEILILYNENYNGKLKNTINRNLNTIKYFIILIKEIEIIINYKKDINEFIEFINTLKIDDYTLKDIDNDIFLYHIRMDYYKILVELFEYLKNILKTIQIFFDEIKNIKDEINNKIKELQIREIKINSSSSLDINRKILDLYIINKNSKSITKKYIINDIIKNIISLKYKNKITELKKIFNNNNIYIFDEYIEDNDDDKIDHIIKILNKENKKKLEEINNLILSQYLKLSSNIKYEDLINEIIFKLINIHLDDLLEDIKNTISLNYEKKMSNTTNEEDIILEIIKNVLLEKDISKKISHVKRILNKNYIKTASLSKRDKTITIIINKIKEIKENENKKNIIKNIRDELNIKGIFILDKYLKEDDYNLLIIFINEIRDILRIEDNIKLKKINNIISKFKRENIINKDLNKIEKYYKFINSWDKLYMYENNNIFYMINETNEIKKEIQECKLLNDDIKDKFLSKITYFSFDLLDNIEIEVGHFMIKIDKIHTYITSFYCDDIMNIMKLYHNIVSNNFKDNKIIENINKILKINNHNSYEYLLEEFKIINKYYHFDYDLISFDNYNNYQKYLEKLYIYKNYIYIIRNLYKFLLSINDNFNLLYTTIEKIRNMIILYKKIDSSLKEILFNKLNDVNREMNNGIIFNDYIDIDRNLNKLIDRYSK